jgi:hypothetical protein
MYGIELTGLASHFVQDRCHIRYQLQAIDPDAAFSSSFSQSVAALYGCLDVNLGIEKIN